MSSTRYGLAVCGLLSASQVGCGSKDNATADSSKPATSGSAKATVSASAKPSASAASATAVPQAHPWINETGRGGAKCEFTKWGENGSKKKSAMFKLSGPPGKEVSNLQTWEFYYDKDGKQLDSYPHSTFIDADTPEQALGEAGDKIPKDTATAECEITRISFKDKTFWFNGNLVPLSHNRPKGGISADVLKASSGEKVTVEVLDAKKGHVKLKNVSDKEVKSVEVDLIYFKEDGTHDYKTDFSVDAALKPGETAEKDVKLGDDKLPEFKSAEAYAPQVHFADDSSWENRNLSGFELPN
jgi:hypothetical protein